MGGLLKLIVSGWDLSHPAAAAKLAEQGADLIFAPAYWLATDSEPYVFSLALSPRWS